MCDFCRFAYLLQLLLTIRSSDVVPGVEYCLEEQLETQCSADEIIQVDNARYGRMRLNKCVRTDYGYIGCGTDVTDILAGRCSGRRRCRIVNLEALFASSRMCPTDLKSYLEASYSCVKGEQCQRFLRRCDNRATIFILLALSQ